MQSPVLGAVAMTAVTIVTLRSRLDLIPQDTALRGGSGALPPGGMSGPPQAAPEPFSGAPGRDPAEPPEPCLPFSLNQRGLLQPVLCPRLPWALEGQDIISVAMTSLSMGPIKSLQMQKGQGHH